jgi:hypothetical protein
LLRRKRRRGEKASETKNAEIAEKIEVDVVERKFTVCSDAMQVSAIFAA